MSLWCRRGPASAKTSDSHASQTPWVNAHSMPDETPNPPAESAAAAFRQWEWLRVAFNVVLGLVLLPWLGEFVSHREFTAFVIKAAIGANLCFCTGPVAEGYAALLKIPRNVSRYSLFIAGTLLAVLLEVFGILNFLHPESD